jgi:radical SAM-linked protein
MELCRFRITFSKGDALKYTSHLDLATLWERSLRRARVGLAYSGGFNPRPRMQLAAALPLGHTGEAEWLDVWLEPPAMIDRFATALVPVLPHGLTISQVVQVELKEPALQTQIASAEYHVTVEWDEPAEQTKARVRRVLAATQLPQERRGRPYDLRPLIEKLQLAQRHKGDVVFQMQLAARQGATARPEAVLQALGMDDPFARYHRKRLITKTKRKSLSQGAREPGDG